MANIKDTASVITDVPKIMGSVPDVSDEMIDTTARFVWAAIMSRVNMATVYQQRRDGRPGIHWSGAVSTVIAELWPEMSGGYTLSKDEIKSIGLAINAYHRESGNLLCIRKGNRGIKSVWWVSQHWSTLTVTKKTDPDTTVVPVENTQEEEEEVMPNASSQVIMYPCRDKDCTYTTEYAQIRAVHERQEHGFAYRDGVRVDIPAGRMTDTEARALILEVAAVIEAPRSKYAFLRTAQERDVRATGPQIHRLLKEMAADPECDLVEHGSSEYYTLYFLTSRITEQHEELVAELRNKQAAPAPTESAYEGMEFSYEDTDTGGTRERLISKVEDLLEDLRTAGNLEVELKSDLEARLASTEEELEKVKAELEEVTKERDQLKQTLAVIRTQIMGKGI